MKGKKFKYPSDELAYHLIDAQLKPYNLTHADVKDVDNWYTKYTFKTHEEFLSWKNYCITVLTKQCTPKVPKKKAEAVFNWFNLDYGLKQDYPTVSRTPTETNIL